jgi:hypothetical protein
MASDMEPEILDMHATSRAALLNQTLADIEENSDDGRIACTARQTASGNNTQLYAVDDAAKYSCTIS